MVATKSPKNSFKDILAQIRTAMPDVTFVKGTSFSWSPKDRVVTYRLNQQPEAVWSLLHEVAHAQLSHTSYSTDFELLKLEVAAWEQCKVIANNLDLVVDQDYVQDCLDSYRDWLHRRSTCPTCGSAGLQTSDTDYHCHNCNSIWHVTAARFCRPYRRKALTSNTGHKQEQVQSVFH